MRVARQGVPRAGENTGHGAEVSAIPNPIHGQSRSDTLAALMHICSLVHQQRWALLLAGGAGRRLVTVTGGRPKQFWSPNGGPTLLEDAASRADRFSPPGRRVTVVDRTHRSFVDALGAKTSLGRLVFQPEDRGTANGVLLGLLEVMTRAPDSQILLTPADHGVARLDLFQAGLRRGLARISERPDRIVVFGIQADSADGQYGWILPEIEARTSVGRCAPVSVFVEKPQGSELAHLYAQGAAWNTMVLVSEARALLELFRRFLPDPTAALAAAYGESLILRQAAVDDAYRSLPRADFSTDLIGHADNLDVYTWPATMGWSDLGTPERVSNWQRRIIPAVA
jgi:mannose-1-phosphate guanylyltransferase